MNICFSSREYPPETGWGGIGTYVYNIAHALNKLGHKVVVVSQAVDGREEDYFDSGVHIFRVRARKIPLIPHIYMGELLNRLEYSYSVFLALTKINKTIPVDIVEIPDWYNEGLFLFLKRSIPYVNKLHGPHYLVTKANLAPRGLSARLIEKLEEFCVQYADGLTSPSRNLAATVSRDYKISDKKIEVIPYPLDAGLFDASLSVSADGPPKILYVGRLEMRKGVHIFIDAMEEVIKEFPTAQAVFIGQDTTTAPDGSSFKRYLVNKIEATGHKDNFCFIGHLRREEIVRYYRSSALGVVPSLYDNFPHVCLEAMGCGLPIVASHIGGIGEIIDDRVNGILVPPGDPNSLADGMIELLKNHELRESISKKAAAKILKDFDAKETALRVINHYQQVLNKKRNGKGVSLNCVQ